MRRFLPYDVFKRLASLNIKMAEKETKIQPIVVPLDTLPERCTMTEILPEMLANEIRELYDRHHKVSPLP